MGVLRSQWPSFLQSPNPEPPLEGLHGHRGQRHDQETRSRRVRATWGRTRILAPGCSCTDGLRHCRTCRRVPQGHLHITSPRRTEAIERFIIGLPDLLPARWRGAGERIRDELLYRRVVRRASRGESDRSSRRAARRAPRLRAVMEAGRSSSGLRACRRP